MTELNNGVRVKCASCGSEAIVLKAAVAELGDEFRVHPLGTGPYELVERIPKQTEVVAIEGEINRETNSLSAAMDKACARDCASLTLSIRVRSAP